MSSRECLPGVGGSGERGARPGVGSTVLLVKIDVQ